MPKAIATMQSEVNTNLADNTTQDISPADARVAVLDLIDWAAWVENLNTLTGVAGGSTDFGTFTGMTIADSRTAKQALQDLETALEASSNITPATIADGKSHRVLIKTESTAARSSLRAATFRQWMLGGSTGAVRVVTGSGTPATDDTNFSAAVSELNSLGGGTIYIDGEVYITNAHNFTAPVSLVGLGRGAVLNSQKTSGEVISWNSGFSPTTATSFTASTPQAFSQYVSSPNWTPNRGDMFLLRSEDVLDGVPPHFTGGFQKPMEIHRAAHWDAGNSRIYMPDFAVDHFTTTPTIIPLTTLNDIVVENLTFTYSGTTQADFVNFLRFKSCRNVHVRGCRVDRAGPGSIWFSYSMDCFAYENVIEGQDKPDGVYGFAVDVVNNCHIYRNTIDNTRHAFTTTSGEATANTRWGTPINTVVSENIINVGSKWDGASLTTRIGLDTHAEGWGIEFSRNHVTVAGDPGGITNIAMQSRSRATRFIDNVITGSWDWPSTGLLGVQKGIRMFGEECHAIGNKFDRVWQGVIVDVLDSNPEAHNCAIMNNDFITVREDAVRVFGDVNNLDIIGNNFRDTGRVTTKAHIEFSGNGTNYRILDNSMRANANLESIEFGPSITDTDVTIENNNFYGYGSGDPGFSGTNAATIETTWEAKNHVDP